MRGKPTIPTRQLKIKQTIIRLVEMAKLEHDSLDDDWTSCPLSARGCANPSVPKGACNCGAAKHNLEVEKLSDKLRILLDSLESDTFTHQP